MEPRGQFALHDAFGEVAVAVGALDLASVLAMRLPTPRIERQAFRVGDGELTRDRPGDDLRHVGRVREERAEKPHRRELNGEPEPVVIAAAIADPLAVKVVEVKEPLELTRRRRLAVAAVAGDLRRAEKVDRHPPSETLKPELSAGRHQRLRRSRSCAAVSAATASAPGWA